MDAHEIRRENLWLRELLRRVSADLEHVAAQTEPAHRGRLEQRAMRIRQRLWEGMPEEWEPRDGSISGAPLGIR